MSEPDFDKLTEVNDELERLYAGGTLTSEDWERLFDEAKKAVGKHTEYLEGTLMQGMEYGFITADIS